MKVETIMNVLLVAPYGGVLGGISLWTGVSQEPNCA